MLNLRFNDGAGAFGRRVLLVLSSAAIVWAVVIALTGGLSIRIGGIRLTARTAGRPLLASCASLFAAWAVAPRNLRHHTLIADYNALLSGATTMIRSSFPTLAIACTCLAVVGVGIQKGTFAAGGADSYGYVSEADLWAHGLLRVDQPIMDAAAFSFSLDAWAPP